MQQKILLVDDREDNLLSVETVLEPGGYTFVKARSGREALKILLTEIDFVLILMDVKMPSLNGFETAEMIYEREKLRHIPIIFITAHDDSEKSIFKGYRSGAVDYISKPINPELLRTKVSIFTDLYQKNHRLQQQEQRLRAINKSLENEIKERKISEEKIKDLNKQLLHNISSLETANKDLDRFVFMASHDLQEPIRKIRTFCDMVNNYSEEPIGENTKNYLKRIQHAAIRMQSLIADIFAFSTVSDDKGEFAVTDLNAIIGDVIHDLETEITRKKAIIETGSIPAIQVKPGLIRLLFQNIIGNALKYSKEDVQPQISISAETVKSTQGTAEARYCRIYIEDNGIGFEQKYAEQIFDMFRRLHGFNEYEGTGIGLALCKKIVEKHNGFINARSLVGKGSTFIVSLPFVQPYKMPAPKIVQEIRQPD
ncbi:MAG: response regulator [Bacteroidota bacterium]